MRNGGDLIEHDAIFPAFETRGNAGVSDQEKLARAAVALACVENLARRGCAKSCDDDHDGDWIYPW